MSAFDVVGLLARLGLFVIGLGLAVLGGALTWGAYMALRRERAHWRALRAWIEYRSQADRTLFPAAGIFPLYDANLEMKINRLASSHAEPLRRRLEIVEAALRRERKIPEPEFYPQRPGDGR